MIKDLVFVIVLSVFWIRFIFISLNAKDGMEIINAFGLVVLATLSIGVFLVNKYSKKDKVYPPCNGKNADNN